MLISSQTPEGRLDPFSVVSCRSSGRISSALIAALIGMVGATAHARSSARRLTARRRRRLGGAESLRCDQRSGPLDGRRSSEGGARSVAFSGDGSRIAAGGWDRWEVDEPGGGRPDAGGHYGGRGFIGAKGGKVRVWEAADGPRSAPSPASRSASWPSTSSAPTQSSSSPWTPTSG